MLIEGATFFGFSVNSSMIVDVFGTFGLFYTVQDVSFVFYTVQDVFFGLQDFEDVNFSLPKLCFSTIFDRIGRCEICYL